MRVGIVGCGYWGSKHVRVLDSLDNVDHVAVIDQDAGRRASLSRSFPQVSTHGDLVSALDDIDAVVIAAPPATHASLGLQAIEAGKHVLVEKPFTTTVADARRLNDTAERAGVTLMVGHTFEYNAAVWMLHELIREDALGKIYYIDSARLNLGLYQRDVNVMWDLAPHDISIANYLLDSTPTSVQAWGSRHAHATLEDVAYMRLLYSHLDVTVQIHVSWLDPCKVRRVTVVGSDKMAVYNDLHDEERVRVYDKGVVHREDDDTMHGVPTSYRYGGIESPYINFQEPLRTQDREFVDCAYFGKEPLAHGGKGQAVVEVLEAAERSLREGGPVDIETSDLRAETVST